MLNLALKDTELAGKVHMGLHGRTSDNSKMITYFKGVDRKVVGDFYENYREDFEIFGYTINDWLWAHLK